MPGPDMVFTESEVDAANHPGAHPRAHHGPDMVFTEAEVAAYDRAHAPAMTVEEADAHARTATPALPPEQRDALQQHGAAVVNEGAGAAGAANDTAGAVGAFRGTRAVPMPAPISDRVLGPVAAVAGAGQMVNSWVQGTRPGATHEDRVQAAFGMGTGALGAAGGVATTAGMSGTAGVLGVGAGALETAQGIRNVASGDVAAQGAGGQQILHGVLAGGSSLATLAGATTAAPVLAAGAAGVSIGTTMQQRADRISLEQGRYTEQRAGRGVGGAPETHAISASDAAVRGGMEDGELTRQAIYDLTGNRTISDGAGWFSGAVNTVGRSIVNTFSNLW